MPIQQMKSTAICAGAFFAILFLLYLQAASPFDFTYISSGLDPSWVAASSWARQHGMTFGSEIVFTSGPLSILHHRFFDRALAFITVAIWLLCVLILAVVTTHVAINQRTSVGNIILVLICAAGSWFIHPPFNYDSVMFLACLILPLSAEAQVKPRWIELWLTFILASLSVAKFSVFPIAVVAVLVCDLIRLLRGEYPLSTFVFIGSLAALFLVTGGTVSGLSTFILSSAEVASGYTKAMSVSGSSIEVAAWMLGAGLLASFAALELRRAWSVSAALVVLILAAFLWICLKAGFVRHDLHSLIAWAGLWFAALVWAFRALGNGRLLYAAVYIGVAVGAAIQGQRALPTFSLDPTVGLQKTVSQLHAALTLVRSPSAWLQSHQEAQDRAKASLKLAAPLPLLNGTIDMIPSAQSELIANDLTYRPRPTVQEYTTYSRKLVDLNRAFFESNRAPEYLLVTPGSIDHRHPASAEGPLWPMLIARYEPMGMVRDYALFRQRKRPIEGLLGRPVETVASFDQDVRFPRPGEAAFVKIEIRQNLFGRIASLIYKTPGISMEVSFQDNRRIRYRLVADIAREGMVLAPTIETATAFALFASGVSPTSQSDWPVAIRVVGRGAGWFYSPKIKFEFLPVNLAPLRDATSDSRFVGELVDRVEDLRVARSRLKANPPMLMNTAEGIYAHAPSVITVPTAGADRILIAFGIRDGAYQANGKTDGVCFSIKATRDGSLLFIRCLNPLEVDEDRGVIEATVMLPPNTREVIAETTCRSVCAWDWSYWRKLRPVPQTLQ